MASPEFEGDDNGDCDEEGCKQQRFKGTPEDFADLLRPLCPRGPTLFTYNEAPKTSQTVVDAAKITKASRLLALLHAGCGTLLFARSIVHKGLAILVNEFGDAWRLAEEYRDAWVTTYEHRVMNITSVVNKGCKKKKPPSWAAALPWMSLCTAPGSSHSGAADDDDGNKSYFYGYDALMGLAWRVVADDPAKRKEYCVRFDTPSGCPADDDEMLAVWADGGRRACSQLTFAVYTKKTTRARRSEGPTFVWEGAHTTSMHRLYVQRRPDRGLLMSLYEQTAQVCSVRVFLFHKPGEEEEGAPAEQRASEFMQTLGKRYASGAAETRDLYTTRHQEEASRRRLGSQEQACNRHGVEAGIAHPRRDARVHDRVAHPRGGGNDGPRSGRVPINDARGDRLAHSVHEERPRVRRRRRRCRLRSLTH